jgi:two-component system, cell cycle response regulator
VADRDIQWMEQTMEVDDKGAKDEAKAQQQKAMPYLVMYSERNMGKRLDLTEAKITMGRSPEADILIDDKRVSKIHCTVQYKNGSIVVEDNNSTNGTFVNGVRITKETLTNNALLQIGATIMKIEFKNKAEVEYEDELLKKATTDALTGVANRHYFMTRSREELSFARRTNILMGLVMMDIDHFKNVNDTYGHQAGDYVLNQFAALVDKNIRGEDILGRYGGEEFVVLMRGEMEPPGAVIFCERIRKTVEAFQFNFNGQIIPVTVSIGVCLKPGKDIETLEDLIAEADKALYRAKQTGRNRVELAQQ